MLTAYYQERDWNPVTGFPAESKLAQLGLGWAAHALEVER
jgi:hypothetical protein